MEARAKDRGETGNGLTDGTPAPYEESPQITNQDGKRQIASFYEQYGDYNLLPTFRGIETGDSCLNNLLDGFVNYVFVGTYNLGATIVNTFTNGIGGIRELADIACQKVVGCDLDSVTMTLMANQMLVPAGIMLDGFNSYMNGLKLMNQSRAANAAISTVQTSVNVSASFVGIDSISSKTILALPAPKGSNPWMEGTKITSMLAPDDCYIYMAMSKGQPGPGYWGTFENIPDVNFARNNLAITPKFKETIDYVQIYKIPKGTRIQTGIAGPQIYNGITYSGGATQVQIFDNTTLIPIGKPKPIK